MTDLPLDLPENDDEKTSRLAAAVLPGLYDEARTYYINLLLCVFTYGATRDQLMSDIRPVEDAAFSETALDTLLNDGTLILAIFDAPHPFELGKFETCRLILHRDNARKVEILQHPGKYREEWITFQSQQRQPYLEVNPIMGSSWYPWNRSAYVEEHNC